MKEDLKGHPLTPEECYSKDDLVKETIVASKRKIKKIKNANRTHSR